MTQKAYKLIGRRVRMGVSKTVDDHAAEQAKHIAYVWYTATFKKMGKQFLQNITTLFRTTNVFDKKIVFTFSPFSL